VVRAKRVAYVVAKAQAAADGQSNAGLQASAESALLK
jgi:hypothetical protein